MASVTISWSPAEEQVLEVQVECEDSRPDVLDDIAARAVHLFTEAFAAVATNQEET